MTEILVILGLVGVIFVAAFLYGKSSEKGKTSKKAAAVSKKQARIAAKPRKRTAKGVAEDIKRRGI